MKKQPLISVIMPVFNAQEYVSQAIESVLHQTYTNIEFVIIDDTSTDRSWQIIQSYRKKDKRIRAFKNSFNRGVSFTANRAIGYCSGDYLVRMDADDISFPDRIGKEFDFLSRHPDVIAVGSQCMVIDSQNRIIGQKNFPLNSTKLEEMIFWAIPIQQPSIMVNLKKLPRSFRWYAADFSSAEEVDLIFRFLKIGRIVNLPDYLLYYRHLDTSLSHKNPKLTFYLTFKSRLKALKSGFRPTPKAIILNLMQVLAINLLPASAINNIWYRLRGITQVQNNLQISTKPSVNLTNTP